MRIASLHVYPVKGMRANDVETAVVEPRGFRHDRRWLAVDPEGTFLTQRSHPALATIDAATTPHGLTLAADGFGAVEIQEPSGSRRRNVVVWGTEVDAAAAESPEGDAFLSKILGTTAHLVFMDDAAQRVKDSEWTTDPVPVSFADAFPILVATTGSLAMLNRDIEQHGGTPVPMARFRPNLVIENEEPWAEDHWQRLQIGEITIDLVKWSDRCIVTTTDQRTGERPNKEPLASLARIHRSTDPRIKGVLFGVNAVPRSFGTLRAGDPVELVR